LTLGGFQFGQTFQRRFIIKRYRLRFALWAGFGIVLLICRYAKIKSKLKGNSLHTFSIKPAGYFDKGILHVTHARSRRNFSFAAVD